MLLFFACAARKPGVLQPLGIGDPAGNFAEIVCGGMAAAALRCEIGFAFVGVADENAWRLLSGRWRRPLLLDGLDDAADIRSHRVCVRITQPDGRHAHVLAAPVNDWNDQFAIEIA